MWWLLPLFSTVVIYTICYLIGRFVVGLSYEFQAIVRDLFLQIVLAYFAYALFRRRWTFVVVQLFVVGLFFLGHAAKVAFHGVPINPDDMYAISDLFWVLEKWQRALMLLFSILPAVLILYGMHWRRMVLGLMLMGAGVLFTSQQTATQFYTTLKKNYVNSVWDARGNLIGRGATLHTIMEGLRYVSDSHDPPTMTEVNEALINLEEMRNSIATVATAPKTPIKARNVHMILMESFWDVTLLKKAGLSRNPFDESFWQLWRETGFSKCLPPVYGGYTANSEFEALTGFPVEENSVKFERRLRNDIPAMPRMLKELGYTTFASHPNVAGFWNRTNAYRRIGFQTYWSIENFLLDDMNGQFLSDDSLYRQVVEKLDPALKSGNPIFNYIVTYTGHVNYPLNDKRPHIIKSKSKYGDVKAYANTVYYKSKELMDFIAVLKKRDPDSLLVVFGDHAPFLGPNHAAYNESKLLVPKMSDWTAEMLKVAYSTPLLIVDGRKGPIKVGTIPLYRLPSLVMSLLGVKNKGMLDYTVQPTNYKIRPLFGRQLVLDGRNHPTLFTYNDLDPANTTNVIDRWMHQMVTLSEDLCVGQQFSLRLPKTPLNQESLFTHQSSPKESSLPNM
jgi:phosphoglycerol transferase MdoB-like AlkP superfamily enzyme